MTPPPTPSAWDIHRRLEEIDGSGDEFDPDNPLAHLDWDNVELEIGPAKNRVRDAEVGDVVVLPPRDDPEPIEPDDGNAE